MLANDDERDGVAANARRRERIEQPEEIELIEHVVLEPEHDLVLVHRRLDLGVACRKVVADVLHGHRAVVCEKPRPQLAPLRRRQARQARAVVQRVGAFDEAPGES